MELVMNVIVSFALGWGFGRAMKEDSFFTAGLFLVAMVLFIVFA